MAVIGYGHHIERQYWRVDLRKSPMEEKKHWNEQRKKYTTAVNAYKLKHKDFTSPITANDALVKIQAVLPDLDLQVVTYSYSML